MPWGWSSEEARQRHLADRAARGMHPRAPNFGHVRVIGAYEIPLYEEVTAVEVMVHMPAWRVDLERWWPYESPGFDEEWRVGRPHFYLSQDGENLVGSYLQQPPVDRYTRMVLLFDSFGCDPEEVRAGSGFLMLPDFEPIPERLLRLIWLEY